MSLFLDLLSRYYDIRNVVKTKEGLGRKIVEVKILFHPKKVFSVTPQVAESKSIYHVYPNGTIDHYDMIYIRKDTMPLLIGIGNNYYLDEWLEIKSWELLHKKISE
jgi:hypothetical protein